MFGDNPERIRSEAAFAKLCGTCPIPASSGQTSRHRLYGGGHRQANAGALPSRHRTNAFPPTHHRLRRSPHHRRPHQKRHHPLPQTVPRPRGLPASHGRPPNPTTHRPRRLNQLLDYRGVNAAAESFLGTLKKELVNRADYHNRHQARLSIRWWIEAWYNPRRLHSTIGQQPPNEWEDNYYHHTAA